MTWKAALTSAAGLAILAQPMIAAGELYMYRDKQGVLHFTNAPAKPGYRPYEMDSTFARARRIRPSDGVRRRAFDPIIRDAGRRHQVDPALIKAVIRVESDFLPYARSPKGALGLMQLMPETARMHSVGRIFEPRENIEGGVKHLRLLLDRYNGNVRLALAAYNAGGRAVARYGGVPPYPETMRYLDRVLRFREHYRQRP